jgi:hypothetical protein
MPLNSFATAVFARVGCETNFSTACPVCPAVGCSHLEDFSRKSLSSITFGLSLPTFHLPLFACCLPPTGSGLWTDTIRSYRRGHRQAPNGPSPAGCRPPLQKWVSEGQAAAQLKFPPRVHRHRDRPKLRLIHKAVRRAVVGVVQSVKSLDAELKAGGFDKAEFACER